MSQRTVVSGIGVCVMAIAGMLAIQLDLGAPFWPWLMRDTGAVIFIIVFGWFVSRMLNGMGL